MKTLIFAILLLLSSVANAWVYDARYPTFTVDGVTFALTDQVDEMGVSVVLLYWTGSAWHSWGGLPDERGIIVEGVTDSVILEHGSLHGFMEWAAEEAMRRARLRAALPPPDPNDRLGRLHYNMLKSYKVEEGEIRLAPAPLP